MSGPLTGVRVLDASAGAVGPWAGALLGGLGAEVIKLEPPRGDFIRQVMPAKRGLSTTYIAMNVNKRGVVLDLKIPAERDEVYRLARDADVFIENFRPGVADRIGVGYDMLSRDNPRLIYASACGFGFTGPMVGIGATDPHLQAFTGVASLNGEPGALRQRWRWYGHMDCTTAVVIVQAVLTALLERQQTGRGRHVKITMTEAVMALQRVRLSEFLSGGSPRPMGSATTYLAPDQAFEALDQAIAVSATNRKQWRGLCDALHRSDLAEDARYASNPLRVANRDTLIPLLEEIFRQRPASYWLRRLHEAGVPATPFLTFDVFREHAHYLANGIINTFQTEDWGQLTLGPMPWDFTATPATLHPGTPPGGANDEVLKHGWSRPKEAK